jgi:DNA methylase
LPVKVVSSADAGAGARTFGLIRERHHSAPTLGEASKITQPVKPTALLEDALLDVTNRSDIVIDPFLGSGSTLIAADNTGRACCGVELDQLFVDVIVRRYEGATGDAATLIETGETFEALDARRASEAMPMWGLSRGAPWRTQVRGSSPFSSTGSRRVLA